MHVDVTNLASSILHQDDLVSSTVAELEQLVNRYPYFVPGRLLYLKKLQQDSSPLFEMELGRAELWVPNTAWLEHLYFQTGKVVPVQPSELREEPNPNSAAMQNPAFDDEPAFISDHGRTNPAFDEEATAHGGVYTEIDEQQQPGTDPSFHAGEETERDVPSNAEESLTDLVPEEEEEKSEETANEAGIEPASDDSTLQAVASDEAIAEAPAADESTLQAEADQTTAAALTADEAAAEVAEQEKEEEEEEEIQEEVEEELEEDALTEKIEFKIPAYREEPVNENQELTFEPFHTVDYFASQGIQAKEEDRPADRFSQQLKSFTQWLKAMKKIPAPEDQPAAISGEKKIEQMAEHSIQGREVLTEAMAEVWIKQGNTAKATEVYRKLSLLDPAKSTYFAAKIEQLKQ